MRNRGPVRLALCAALLLTFSSPFLQAKETTPQVVVWPEAGVPVLQFTFGKFHQLASIGGQHAYTVDTQVKNLWTKPISAASFDLYLFDKNKVRIGEGWISVNNAAPGDVIKFETHIAASGDPVSLKVEPRALPAELSAKAPPKTITMTVNSVPQGARFMLDGKDVGITPREIEVGVGTHQLEFDKEGYNHGKYPFAVGPADVSAASISYELGTSAHDTIELRDGTIVSGDLLSMTATDLTVKIGGAAQTIERNQVKRITLVQREDSAQ